jgi:hypothetical protein
VAALADDYAAQMRDALERVRALAAGRATASDVPV